LSQGIIWHILTCSSSLTLRELPYYILEQSKLKEEPFQQSFQCFLKRVHDDYFEGVGFEFSEVGSTSEDLNENAEDAIRCLTNTDFKFFNPKISLSILKADVFDADILDSVGFEKINKLSKDIPINDPSKRKKIISILSRQTISDDNRKDLWARLIGNRLRITKHQFQRLEIFLDKHGIPSHIDKMIIGDLDRTFPPCESYQQGEIMYNSLLKILRLFCLLRPDIQYIQGMTAIVSFLYYYYDEYWTFLLFSNLMVTNNFLYSVFTFKQHVVQIY